MKAALVTGAGRRIGAAVAQSLGEQGWYTFIHYNKSRSDAESVLSKIVSFGGNGEVVQADLLDMASLRNLMNIFSSFCSSGAITRTCLINNASLFEYDTFQSMSEQSWHNSINTNLRAPIFIAQEYASRIQEGSEGCIINMLDNKVFAINPDFFSYTVSKVALHGATAAMAMALAPQIRVCGIAPGITLISGKQTQESFQIAHKKNLLGRGCSIEEIVAAVKFILTTPSYNGQVVTIDGGQSLMKYPRDVAFLPEGF
jgi:NAD(P)-dependent dehydrogenase (short-subunit alcohol dehydrogenase family)